MGWVRFVFVGRGGGFGSSSIVYRRLMLPPSAPMLSSRKRHNLTYNNHFRSNHLLQTWLGSRLTPSIEITPVVKQANIGWKSFVITKAVSTKGCIDDWEGESEIGSSFGTGIIKKATVSIQRSASSVKKWSTFALMGRFYSSRCHDLASSHFELPVYNLTCCSRCAGKHVLS